MSISGGVLGSGPLLTDDSDDTREMYAAMLRLEGFVVEEAHDEREGVAKAIEFLPAVIVTDLVMPVTDGWETIRRPRADERTRRTRSSRALVSEVLPSITLPGAGGLAA